jgi:hypothetical protein
VYRGVHASKAWNEYLTHKDKMVKLLPDDDDIPALLTEQVSRGWESR